MNTLAAFIDFKSGNLTSRSIQIINLVNSIAKNFSELEKVCFYTLDSVDAVGINTSIPSTLIQIKGLQEDSQFNCLK
jgi:hypothetical protein